MSPRRFPHSLLLLAALLVSATAFLAPPPAQAQQPSTTDTQVLDEIVAVVGNDVVLRSEVEGQMQAYLQRQHQGRVPPRSQLWSQILQRRIDQQVMAVHARRDTTINASEAQVQRVLERRISRLAERVGGREQLEQAYGKTINELKADFEDPIRDQILAQRLEQRRLNGVRITPSEVREWFAEIPQDSLPMVPATVQLSHIVRLPQPTESAQRQAREVITALHDSAKAGVPIEELARRYSDDADSAPQGGREQQALSDLVPSFAAVVSRAPIGEITQVFQTPLGYHIARVNERSGNTVDYNHVLIEVDKSTASGDEARQYLSAVRDSIVEQGAPFGLMASRHSEEERSAGQGGRVIEPQSGQSTLRLEALGPSWKSSINALKEGQISQPTEVRLLDGERAFHIVKLTERTPRHRMNLEQDYARIKAFALQEKKRRVYQKWVQQLREDVYVDVRVPSSELSAGMR